MISVTQFLTKGQPTSRTRHWPVWCRKARTEVRVVPWSAAQTQAHCRQQLEARLVTVFTSTRNWSSWSESAGSLVTTNTELPNLTSYLAPVVMGKNRAARSQL